MTAEQKLDILRLRKEGMKTKDIAKVVQLSEPNVKKILHDVHDVVVIAGSRASGMRFLKR